MIATSFLTPRQARRVSLLVLLAAIVLMLAALFIGTEVKGARRWIDVCGLLAAAVRIHEAGIRRGRRLAVRGKHPPRGHPRQCVRADPAGDGRGAAGRRARLRPDDAGGDRVGRAVLPGRRLVAVDRGARGARPSAGIVAAYAALPHVAVRIDRFLDRRSPATRSRSTRRSPRSCAAAGSARDRARGSSSASSRTRTPTSSSRSRRKNSASSPAWRWWPCSR